jgi:hypothetical protein
MPRYFFHVIDGYSTCDEEGTELPDIYAAQHMAIRASGEILRDMGATFWNGTEWKLEVADEHGQILFVLRFSAEERLASPTTGSHLSSL